MQIVDAMGQGAALATSRRRVKGKQRPKTPRTDEGVVVPWTFDVLSFAQFVADLDVARLWGDASRAAHYWEYTYDGCTLTTGGVAEE